MKTLHCIKQRHTKLAICSPACVSSGYLHVNFVHCGGRKYASIDLFCYESVLIVWDRVKHSCKLKKIRIGNFMPQPQKHGPIVLN